MKRTATITVTYDIEFEVPDGASDDYVESAAWAEWERNPSRKPSDYECSVDVVEPDDEGPDDDEGPEPLYAGYESQAAIARKNEVRRLEALRVKGLIP